MKIAVKSSAIASLEYDKNTRILSVEFNHGGTYDYPGVPESEFENFVHAESIGKYFHAHIKQYSAIKRHRSVV